MKLALIAAIILAALVNFAPRSEARNQLPYPHGQLHAETKNQVTTKTENKQPERKMEAYLNRLFSPENLPNIALYCVGSFGIIVGIFTLFVLIEQTKATKRAAVAALLNAQAVLNSERPWILIPTKSEFSEIEQPMLFARLPGEFRISYCNVWIKNCGRTPARIIEQKIRLVVGRELQAIPDPAIYYEPDAATPENYMFPPDDKIVVQAAFPDGFISAEDLTQVTSKEKKTRYIWLCGYFKYVDAFGRIESPIYETRICYRWVYDAQSQIDSDIHKNFWIMAGPREYNRAT
ncbi:MAG TPA: hypothetical protein VN902_03050 [Candidatus Acidoferrales bacterium]|nr:hypothetical protein [Candidatus Acidoferrales bacterium]